MLDFTPFLISVDGWVGMWDFLYDGISYVVEWMKTHYIYYESQDGAIFQVSYFNIEVAFTLIAIAWLTICGFMDNSPSDDSDNNDD